MRGWSDKRFLCCDSCRSIRIDATDGRGADWRVTYLDPAIL
jgi:hypothetical protein